MAVAPDRANVVAMKPKPEAQVGMTARALPRSLEDLRGRRAARWIPRVDGRPGGQLRARRPGGAADPRHRALGPRRHGRAWQVAHSGRTIAATGQWAEMLDGAGRDWDVLVVGYVSRFARDLRTAVNARHDLHARGAVILFADERVLSSDEDEWERWAREAVEAEAYSRRLGKRVPGRANPAKRRRLGVPGGRARRRSGRSARGRTIEIDGSLSLRLWCAASTSSRAAGRTDREVGKATGLALKHVAEVLTNPFYFGRLLVGVRSPPSGALDRLADVGPGPGHAGAAHTPPPGIGQPPPVRPCGAAGLRGLRPAPHGARRAGSPLRTPARRSGPPRPIAYPARRRAKRSTRGCVASPTRSRRTKTRLAGCSSRWPSRRRSRRAPWPLARAAGSRRRRRPRHGADQPGSVIGRPCSSPRIATSGSSRRRWPASTPKLPPRPSGRHGFPRPPRRRAYLELLPDLWAKTSDAGRHAIAEAVFERIDVLGASDFLRSTSRPTRRRVAGTRRLAPASSA